MQTAPTSEHQVPLSTGFTLPLHTFRSILLALALVCMVALPLSAQETQSNEEVPTAVIVSPGLNVRSGPGFAYVVVGYVQRGEAVEILSQVENCRWLQVQTARWGVGWVSGKSDYVTINVSCDKVGNVASATTAQPILQQPQPATNASSSSLTASNTPTQSAATPTPLPTATPQPSQNKDASYASLAHPPAGKGCYLLQNRLGPEIVVTFTNLDSGQSVQIIVPHGAEVPHCMLAGQYTYTISAVGFKDQNGEMKVIAGDAYMLPIGSQ